MGKKSKKFTSISYKIFVPLIVVMFLAVTVVITVGYIGINNMKEDTIKSELRRVAAGFANDLDARELIFVSNMVSQSSNGLIKEALTEGDTSKASSVLKGVKQLYQGLEGAEKLYFALYLPDGTLLGSTNDADQFGVKGNWSIEKVIKSTVPFATIDWDKEGIVTKGLAPIVDNGKLLGVLEIRERTDYSFATAAKRFNVIFMMNMTPEASKYATSLPDDKVFNGGKIVNAHEIDYGLLKEVAAAGLNPNDDYRLVSGVFIIPFELKDSEGKQLGTLYIAESQEMVFALVENATALSVQIIVMFLVSFFIVLIIIYIIVSSSVLGPMRKFNRLVKDLSEGEGDLTKRLNINVNDEIGQTAGYVDSFVEKIQNTVIIAMDTSNETSSSGEELSSTAIQLSNNITAQLNIVGETEELTKDVAKNLDVTEERAIITTEELENTRNTLDGFVASLHNLVDKVNEENRRQKDVSDKMNDVSARAEEITGVLTIISEIADQTNLLALNASIEAARAGEHGKGFAVVADEVRKLAERTQNSLETINKMAKMIIESVNDAFKLVETSSDGIRNVAQDAGELITEGDNTVERLHKATDISSDVVKKTTYIATKTKNLIEVMHNLVEISQNNEEAGKNVRIVSEHLAERSSSLNSVLSKFRV